MIDNAGTEVVPGLPEDDLKKIADQVFSRNGSNNPQSSISENGFLNILQNEKPVFSASSVFIKKAVFTINDIGNIALYD